MLQGPGRDDAAARMIQRHPSLCIVQADQRLAGFRHIAVPHPQAAMMPPSRCLIVLRFDSTATTPGAIAALFNGAHAAQPPKAMKNSPIIAARCAAPRQPPCGRSCFTSRRYGRNDVILRSECPNRAIVEYQNLINIAQQRWDCAR